MSSMRPLPYDCSLLTRNIQRVDELRDDKTIRRAPGRPKKFRIGHLNITTVYLDLLLPKFEVHVSVCCSAALDPYVVPECTPVCPNDVRLPGDTCYRCARDRAPVLQILKPLTTLVFERYEAQCGKSVGVAIDVEIPGETVPLRLGEICVLISNCVDHLTALLSAP